VAGIQRDPLDGMGAARFFGGQLGKPFANRYRRAEVKVSPAQPLTLRPREIHQPRQILRPLATATCLRRHQRHLMQLLVHERQPILSRTLATACWSMGLLFIWSTKDP
jgi:hypothetical protein